MKILLINNHTDYLYNVKNALKGHDIEVQVYKPGLEFRYQDKDLVVLSGGGGEGFEVKDTFRGKLWYEDEMDFVLRCDKPILGICMGFEVIAAAYGSKVEHMGDLIKGFKQVQVTALGEKETREESLNQFEWHQYGVKEVSSQHFETLAYSDNGIEMIRHRGRPILATQFHPEVGGTLTVETLVKELLRVPKAETVFA